MKTANAKIAPQNSSQVILPKSFKWLSAVLSIFIPWFLLSIVFYFGLRDEPQIGFAPEISMLFYVPLVYAIAGGFNWKKSKWSISTYFILALLTAVIYSIPLFAIWILVRFLLAKLFRLPFQSVRGMLLSPRGDLSTSIQVNDPSANRLSKWILKILIITAIILGGIALITYVVSLLPQAAQTVIAVIAYIAFVFGVYWLVAPLFPKRERVSFTTKSCPYCKHVLPNETKVGDDCPYCHVHFTAEHVIVKYL